MRVAASASKHRLFIGGINRDVSQERLLKLLRKEVVGVDSIDMPMACRPADAAPPRRAKESRV